MIAFITPREDPRVSNVLELYLSYHPSLHDHARALLLDCRVGRREGSSVGDSRVALLQDERRPVRLASPLRSLQVPFVRSQPSR